MKYFLQILFIFVSSYKVSYAYHIGLGAYEDFNSMFALAESGDADAQLRLGIDYFDHGAIDDARYWLTELAEKGNVEAQYRIGITFLGWGIETENQLAIYWLTRAAQNGHKSATYMIITRYSFGSDGFPKDKEKAKYWRKVARERRDET